MNINTHQYIDRELCGTPVKLSEGTAVIEFTALENMKVDTKGLIHGGFIFGLADYAAMLAVNNSTVVLAGAEVSFTRPARVGDKLIARAEVFSESGKKQEVSVTIFRNDESVFTGNFYCVVPEKHVLDK